MTVSFDTVVEDEIEDATVVDLAISVVVALEIVIVLVLVDWVVIMLVAAFVEVWIVVVVIFVDNTNLEVAVASVVFEPLVSHCASFGYTHVPDPEKLLHSSSVKVPVLHESGQQRLISFPYQ